MCFFGGAIEKQKNGRAMADGIVVSDQSFPYQLNQRKKGLPEPTVTT